MENIIINGLQQGLVFAFMSLGVLLTFQILDFPDLTVEGSFPLGAAVTAKGIILGFNPLLAVLSGAIAGGIAGAVTALISTRLRINNILAGIITSCAIYTVMLRTMGRPNTPLLGEENLFDFVISLASVRSEDISYFQYQLLIIVILFILAVFARLLLGGFFQTDLGLAVRATGNNDKMIRSLGVNTDNTQLLTLIISNFLVALSGALACQIQGFADVGMGIGVLIAAIASVMIGTIFFGGYGISILLTGVILGSIIYRTLLAIGLRLNLPAEDFKLVTAVLVLLALSLPKIKGKTTKVVIPSDLQADMFEVRQND